MTVGQQCCWQICILIIPTIIVCDEWQLQSSMAISSVRGVVCTRHGCVLFNGLQLLDSAVMHAWKLPSLLVGIWSNWLSIHLTRKRTLQEPAYYGNGLQWVQPELEDTFLLYRCLSTIWSVTWSSLRIHTCTNVVSTVCAEYSGIKISHIGASLGQLNWVKLK